MTTDTRDALLNAVLAELNSLREHAEASDVCNYGTLSTTFVREHCDRIEAALRTPRTEDARDAVVTAAWALDALMPTGDGLRYFHAGFEVKQLRAALAALTQPEAK